MSTTHKSSVEQRLDRHETLLMSCVQEIKELRAMLNTERQKNDQQESQLNQYRSRSEQLNQSSSRSGSRHRSRTPSRGSVCYYHYRYGEKATKYSGSVISILPAQKFANGHSKEELVLFAANSSRISTYGKRTLELDLSLRRSFSWQFVVADVATAIIGADFLSNYNLLIDLKGRRLIDSTTGLTSDGKVLKAQQFNISTVNPAEPFKDLLAQYIAITKPQVTTNNKSSLFAHRITTTGPPLASRFRKIFGEKAVAARSEIQDLLNRGILRPSNSPWASPIHMVPKKNGTFRMCGDYRRLNANTLPDRYPPPLIQDVFNNLHQKAVFSTIDLEKAYHQVHMHEEDIQKTAIITPWGLFEYLRMPFGLKNAAQTFQRFINHIFQDFNFVYIYIDDILVMSTDMNEHRSHLQLVFEKLQEYSLTINLEKCAFGKDEVNFLGYKLSAAGYSPSPDRVEKIINYPKPSTVIELRRFLGMVNYYRKSIPKAANIQAPLYDKLKEALANTTLLHFPSSIANINLITDASTTAIGATLEQEENGAWHPIGFFSRKLTATEQRYSTYDRELLAIFAALKVIRTLLLMRCPGSMPSKLTEEEISQEQSKDVEMQTILNGNTSNNLQKLTLGGYPVYCNRQDNCVKPYLPQSLRRIAFDIVHGNAHPSIRITSRELRRRFSHIHIDIIKLPNVNGYPYCLTIIDRFTRWPEAVPLKNISADTIVQALFANWISRFGTPCVITSDQGCQFESAIFKSLMDAIGAKKIRTTAYHPQSNGLVERWHRTLKTALMCSPEPWIEVLPVVLLGLRSSYKEDLEASPAEITTTGPPLASRFRKIFGEKAVAARSEIQDLLNRGILRPSNSPWASPIHMVPKKNGTFRMCGDYRRLNANTLPDRYPPPLIQDVFNNLHQKAVFSTIDLEKAYHQVHMHEEDIQKTAIITPWGLFEYLRMPFGLKNAAQTFQRFINHIFQDFNFVYIYIDDILVMSTDMNEHRSHLQLVFEKLQEYSLTINLEKCAFGKDEVNFLGYKLSAAGYSPSPDRVEKIINYPKPSTVIELRRFLGMVNYYRKSIPKAANIQAPLYDSALYTIGTHSMERFFLSAGDCPSGNVGEL
ncbi:uncharacterized protein LOC113369433 [Ctenocephalides felis]|uniref:uncharacterized protein LOC113369433 n=1 Tax=Ctenocephalides felis TaxID=7515 RepID=UPI000E6E31AB|nr:uncharacterized protein LOC113369433 [Ctenocephalides felis]